MMKKSVNFNTAIYNTHLNLHGAYQTSIDPTNIWLRNISNRTYKVPVVNWTNVGFPAPSVINHPNVLKGDNTNA